MIVNTWSEFAACLSVRLVVLEADLAVDPLDP